MRSRGPLNGPSSRATGLIVTVLAMGLVLAACGGSGTPAATGPPAPSRTSPSPSPTRTPTPSPSVTQTPTPPPTPECSPETVLAGMSEEQRVGQLFTIGLIGDRLQPDAVAAVQRHHFGSAWFTETSTAGAGAVRAVADAVQALATRANTAGVRFLIAANQEGGLIDPLRGDGFSTIPSALTQGGYATATLRADAATWGAQLAAAGVNQNFAPVMDVVPPGADESNKPIGALKREFGHDPATAGSHGAAFLGGMAQAGILTVAKHFPGLGRVEGNTDFTDNVVDDATTRDDPYLASFGQAIDAGVPFVMVATATYTKIDPDHLAAFSPIVIGGMLRGDLGFDGVVASDDLGEAKAVASIPAAERGLDFLLAGGDLIVSKTLAPAEAMAGAILSKVGTDASLRARVDEAALRILRAKASASLLGCE